MTSRPGPALSRAEIATLLDAVPNWTLGVEGATNQGRLFNETMRHAHDGAEHLTGPAACLLYWAWQQRPLNEQLLPPLAGALNPLLPEQARSMVAAILTAYHRHGDVLRQTVDELNANMDAGLFEAADISLNKLEPLLEIPPLMDRLRAEWERYAFPDSLLAAGAEKTGAFSWWRAGMQAGSAAEAGDRNHALALYAELWRAMPWHVNLSLTLSTMLHPMPGALPRKSGDVCLLLYTWNKANALHRALDHLAASDTGAARLVVLDNGSSDDTSALLEAELERRGLQNMTLVRLPVNVGAPAARNWLLSLEEVKRCKWLAFLDDDILLPPNWLEQLYATALSHADVGAIGCRVVDGHPPHALQAADFHLFAPSSALPPPTAEGLAVADTGIGARETSLFAYRRPCLSVTGCCHLINTRAIERAGGFDIRFTPSQFDDFERDLRSALAGMQAVYDGTVTVPHLQHSSMRQATDARKAGHIQGNLLKLEHLYTQDQKDELRRRDHETARADLDQRLDELYGMFEN